MSIFGFNPCFNGSDSKSKTAHSDDSSYRVSILVLMEVTLKGDPQECILQLFPVSILVLMEVTLKDNFANWRNGANMVSILVLMEVTLKAFRKRR